MSYRLKQNLLAIPFFARLKKLLETKKTFKMLGAFDLLSTLFEMESLNDKETLFKVRRSESLRTSPIIVSRSGDLQSSLPLTRRFAPR